MLSYISEKDKRIVEGINCYIRHLQGLPKEESAKISKEALIRTGVLNQDGTIKKTIVTL